MQDIIYMRYKELKLPVLLMFLMGIVACTSTTIKRISFSQESTSEADFSVFQEFDASANNAISYDGLSYFLSSIVVDVGFSARRSVSDRSLLYTGTRIKRGSQNALILETNRIDFANLNTEQKQQITQYRNILEAFPLQRPLKTLNRDEQLAYWINLHNITLLEQIALNFPVSSVDRLMVDGAAGKVNVLDAKLLTINGVALSLNDIRINIVYRYWQDQPEVIYGFFHGTLGGPSIIPRAYSGEYVNNYLNRNASEFVNSLRGVKNFYSTLLVSPIYGTHRDIFFPDWPNDVTAHLERHARLPVSDFIPGTKNIKFSRYDNTLAGIFEGRTEADRGPGAPAAQAVSIDATGASSFVGTDDPGPLGGPNPDIGAIDSQILGTIASNTEVSTTRSDFFNRLQTKKRRAPSDFWPEIPVQRNQVIIEDVDDDN